MILLYSPSVNFWKLNLIKTDWYWKGKSTTKKYINETYKYKIHWTNFAHQNPNSMLKPAIEPCRKFSIQVRKKHFYKNSFLEMHVKFSFVYYCEVYIMNNSIINS